VTRQLPQLLIFYILLDIEGVWIVALMESLASQGEFMILRELADKNAYKGKLRSKL
jgi:hypothetical protein